MIHTVRSRSTAGSSCQLISEINTTGTTTTSSVPHLSFSGCGFLGIYHVGVASCCREYAPHLVAQKIAGASAGALVACALITDCCLGECTTFTLNLALQARSRALGPLSPSFQLVRNLRRGLDKFLPDNAHEIASGRLHISLTRVSDKQNFIVNQFNDKNDLIDALICSSFVPLYSGVLPPKYHGVRYVDGALSDNIPVLDDATITVSPFAGESDICPNDFSSSLHHINLAGTSIQLTCSNLYRMSVAFFPPAPEVLSNMCRQGFDDALRYLHRNKLISCSHHLSIQSAIIAASPIKFHNHSAAEPMEVAMETTTFDQSAAASPGDVAMDTVVMETSDSAAHEDDDDVDDEECDQECMACDERERFALLDSPPVTVLAALQAACDRVNRGFMARLYKTKAYRAVSLMATPYFLPFEMAFLLVHKFYDWAPYMSEDVQWFVKGLFALVRDVIVTLQQSDTDKPVTSSSVMERGRVLSSWGFTWEMHWGFQLQTVRSLSSSTASDRPKSSLVSPGHQSSALNVNMGISVDYAAAASSGHLQSPLQYVTEARRHVLSAADTRKIPRAVTAGPSDSQRIISATQTPHDSSYDSFDDCLQAANHMDAVLAYYYADEKDSGAVKVVEIFPIHQHHPPTITIDTTTNVTTTTTDTITTR